MMEIIRVSLQALIEVAGEFGMVLLLFILLPALIIRVIER